MDSRKFSFYSLSTWIFLYFAFSTSSAELKTHYVEDLCNGWSERILYLKTTYSGILVSYPNLDSGECTIRLHPEMGSSVVLSLYRFILSPADQLTITDYDKFQVALLGEGDFPDERKSFTSNGDMVIRYKWNNTEQTGSKLKFQFVFTQVRHSSNGQCMYNEFKCRNKLCAPIDFVCDRHNHCGDNSDQEDCAPKIDPPKATGPPIPRYRKVTTSSFSSWGIITIVCSVILAITIIVFVVLVVRSIRRKKKLASKTALPGVASHSPPLTTVTSSIPPNPSAPPATEAPPTLFARFRQSLRSIKASPTAPPEEPKTDSYQVPSMYPQISSVPEVTGVDNPEFKGDEA